MIKYSFELEDVPGSITQTENGKYFLTVEQKDAAGETMIAEKEITGAEAAAILFGTILAAAEKTQKDFPIQLIP